MVGMNYAATTQALALCISENVPVILWGNPGQGKALATDTKIPTPDGFKLMGEIEVGDTVYDEQGKHTEVIGVYPQPIGRECYNIEIDGKYAATADEEHLWQVNLDGANLVLSTAVLLKIHRNSDISIKIPVVKTSSESPVLTEWAKQDFDTSSDWHYITNITHAPSTDVACIAVDSPSHLYLFGERFIPTHNTSVIQNISATYGFYLQTIIASIHEPSDFAGLPYFDKGSTGAARYLQAAPDWAHKLREAAEGSLSGQKQTPVAFFDEISTAPPAVQAALLRPILERVVGQLELPPATRMLAAANPPSVAADGWDLSPPAANRFTHLDWELDAETVKEGFTVGWPHVSIPIPPKASARRLSRNWAKGVVGNFLARNPALVTTMPDNFSGMSSRNNTFSASTYAFPTPRSWEMAARLYGAYVSSKFPDGTKPKKSVLSLLLTGTVGKAAAREFIAFAQSLDLPDPQSLLANPDSFEVPDRGDQLDTTLSSVLSFYESIPSEQNWRAFGDVLAKTVEAGKGDVAYSYMKRWNALRPQGVSPSREQSRILNQILSELDPNR